MEHSANAYVLSFEAVPSPFANKRTRYHWMICLKHDPDQMVSWGHAATQEEAEAAARLEIRDLSSGLTLGGRVIPSPPKVRMNRH